MDVHNLQKKQLIMLLKKDIIIILNILLHLCRFRILILYNILYNIIYNKQSYDKYKKY